MSGNSLFIKGIVTVAGGPGLFASSVGQSLHLVRDRVKCGVERPVMASRRGVLA